MWHQIISDYKMILYPNQINVRESSEMDQADIELRTTIIKCWPHTKRDKIDLLVPTLKRECTHPYQSEAVRS